MAAEPGIHRSHESIEKRDIGSGQLLLNQVESIVQVFLHGSYEDCLLAGEIEVEPLL